MTVANLSQPKQWTHQIRLQYRVPRGKRLPVSPNDIVRKWGSLPGVVSITDSTRFRRDGKFDELRGPIIIEFATQADLLQALSRRH